MAGSKKTKKAKDLSPKKSVKGGAVRQNTKPNENLTLVRAAKPKVKDLPPKKSPKGGKAGHKRP